MLLRRLAQRLATTTASTTTCTTTATATATTATTTVRSQHNLLSPSALLRQFSSRTSTSRFCSRQSTRHSRGHRFFRSSTTTTNAVLGQHIDARTIHSGQGNLATSSTSNSASKSLKHLKVELDAMTATIAKHTSEDLKKNYDIKMMRVSTRSIVPSMLTHTSMLSLFAVIVAVGSVE